MIKHLSVAAGLLVSAVPAFAQSARCPGGTPTSTAQITQDACQQASDLFQYMAPQLGTAIAGGNATLGQGGSLGGLGHFTVGLRVNAVDGSIPQIDKLTPRLTGASPARQFPTEKAPVPMPVLDAAIGIYQGFPLGLTNVGGIDLLVSAAYVPDINESDFALNPDTPLKLGYGIRVSALQESLIMPGVSATFIKRDLPKMSMTGVVAGDSLQVKDLDLQTSAWRIVASKSLIMFGLALGYGQDTYKSSTTVSGVVATPLGPQRSGNLSQTQDVKRTSMFADLSFNLPFFKIVGEIGQVSGGTLDQATFNTFEGKSALDSRLYGSLGLRLGW